MKPTERASSTGLTRAQLVENLRDSIIFGDLPPGTRLRVAHVASEHDVSVATVLQALRSLENMGLVVRLPQRGARVSAVDFADLDLVAAVRDSLETTAIRRAAERFTPGDQRRATLLLNQQEDALRLDDRRQLMAVNAEFHFTLYAIAGSPSLLRAIKTTFGHMERYTGLLYSNLGRRPGIEPDYSGAERVRDACAAHDPDRAAEELRQHIRVAVHYIRSLLDQGDVVVDEGDVLGRDSHFGGGLVRLPYERWMSTPAETQTIAPPPTAMSLGDWAAGELRERILSGELKPGQPLRLESLASLLGTGVFPVRQSLRELERLGLVEHVPNQGARVAKVSSKEFDDVSRTRLTLEPLLLGRAALRLSTSDEQMAKSWLRDYADAVSNQDIRRARESHRKFHFSLYLASGSTWPIQLLLPLWMTSDLRGSAHKLSTSNVEEHALLLQACKDHDKARAEELLTAHLHRKVGT